VGAPAAAAAATPGGKSKSGEKSLGLLWYGKERSMGSQDE